MNSYEIIEDDFDILKKSTQTIMVYTNLNFKLNDIFENLPISDISDPPLTKKKKSVDKSRLRVPHGTIINVQFNNKYRGLNLKKPKKYWCKQVCQVHIEKDGKQKDINTIISIPSKINNSISDDQYEFLYFCENCKKYYTLQQISKIVNFLNQVTLTVSLGNINLNIMIFKDSIKIAGCKSNDDAFDVIKILWNKFRAVGYHKLFSFRSPKDDSKENEYPTFIFDTVMSNIDFKIGNFYINRQSLNRLFNSKEHENIVDISNFETTTHTNVNIKLFSKQPDDFMYNTLSVENEEFIVGKTKENIYKTKKKEKEKYITFIVFSSSETILSGRYESEMKRAYKFFIDTIRNNLEKIIETESSKEEINDFLSIIKNMKS